MRSNISTPSGSGSPFFLACWLYIVYAVRALSIIVAVLSTFTYVYGFAISSYEDNMQVIDELKNFDPATIGMILVPIIAIALFILSFCIKPRNLPKNDGCELKEAKKQFLWDIAKYVVVWIIASAILTKVFYDKDFRSAALLFGILIGLYLTGVIFAWWMLSGGSSYIVGNSTLVAQGLVLKLIVCAFLGLFTLVFMLHKNIWRIAKSKVLE